MTFGGITIACGIVGTIAGGYILDRMNATIPNAFKVNYVVLFVSFVLIYFLFVSFTLKT